MKSSCSASGTDFCGILLGFTAQEKLVHVAERKWQNAFRCLAGSLSDTLCQSHTKETWEVKQVTPDASFIRESHNNGKSQLSSSNMQQDHRDMGEGEPKRDFQHLEENQ